MALAAAISRNAIYLCQRRYLTTLPTVSKVVVTSQHVLPPVRVLALGLEKMEPPSSLTARLSACNIDEAEVKVNAWTSANHSQITVQEYKLPTTWYNGLHKRTIVDPVFSNTSYELPTFVNPDVEKFDPSRGSLFPVLDPNPLQRVIDQGAPPITKETMPRLITIRHKKMKKHQLRKLRKRMRFLRRKLEAVKRKKREKVLQNYENNMKKWSQEFDAEKFVDDHLMRARKAGWEIDILAERTQKRSG